MDPYENLVESIITFHQKGKPKMEQEVYQNLKETLLSELEDVVNAEILNRIPDSEIPLFNKVLDSENETELIRFYNRVLPDMQSIILNAMTQFRNRYIPQS